MDTEKSIMIRYQCDSCGNRCLQHKRPDNTECGGCSIPNWKIMKNQEAYITGKKNWVHPQGEI